MPCEKWQWHWIVYVFASVALWQVSNIVVVRVIEYQAMASIFTGRGRFVKRLANALVLLYFSELWGILWALEVLSFGKADTSKLIEGAVREVRVFTPSYCVQLPTLLCTKKWWRLLKGRKPRTEVTVLMKYMFCIATANFAYMYYNVWGVGIWTFYVVNVVPCGH